MPTPAEVEAALTDFENACKQQTDAQTDVNNALERAMVALREAETANNEAINWGSQVDAKGDVLADLLRAYRDNQPQPEPISRLLLAPRTGYTGSSSTFDRTKLLEMFYGGDPDVAGPMFWADASSSIEAHNDGSFTVWFERARRTSNPNSGGSSWVNAALPLSRPVTAAALSFDIDFPISWGGYGISGKLPGLMRWVRGITPGGGVITPGNYSVRGCWNDWGRNGVDIRFGPYVYSWENELPPESGDYYPVRYASGGSLLWYRPVTTPLDNPAGQTYQYSQLILPSTPGRHRVSTSITHGADSVVAARDFTLVPNGNADITHVTFCFMYGGDTLAYGPAADTKLTIRNFRVNEIA